MFGFLKDKLKKAIGKFSKDVDDESEEIIEESQDISKETIESDSDESQEDSKDELEKQEEKPKDVDKESEEKIEDEFYKLITVFSDKLDIYLDYDKILESFIESIIDNNDGIKNRCTECNVDMGYSNPRQLCGKTYCMNI